MASPACFRPHQVNWQETRLSDNGSRFFCGFRAPDAESVRINAEKTGANSSAALPIVLERY